MIPLLQWNLNGYTNNYNELQLLIQDHAPAIILLNETHISFNLSAFTPKQYIGMFHNLPHISTGKRGIAILIRRDIPHKINAIQSNLLAMSIEIILVKKITIICTYIAPDEHFTSTDILQLINQASTPLIFAGDFNAWSPLWGSPIANKRGKCIEDALLSSNLICLNNGSATHFSTHSTFSHVDLTMCTDTLATECEWSILDHLHGSDHFPIVLKLHLGSTTKNHKINKVFKTDYADWEKFQTHCEINGNNTPISDNPNQESARLTKIIRSAANVSIPHTKPTASSKSVPWWNKEIAELRAKKQTAWYEYKRARSLVNLISFRKANALFRRSAKQAKRKCFQDFTSKINPSSSPKLIWNALKKLSGVPRNLTIQCVKGPTGLVTNPSDISELFANHYSETSSDISFSTQFQTSKTTTLSDTSYSVSPLSFSAKQIETSISLSEFEFVASTVKGKSPGQDKISYPIIRHMPKSLKLRLVKLYNKIFNTGVYPQFWKTSCVIPILKPHKSSDELANYRPISLLPCMGKILEKIVANRLMWYAQRNKFISPNQVAYKKGQGTLDALIQLDYFITNALSSKNHVSVLSLDFHRAFDKIGAHIIIRQLRKWKIGQNMIRFITNFLTNRKLKVNVNGFLSSTLPLSNGTPQGSPLSALLFIIAFDDISRMIKNYKGVEHQIYADDVLIYTKVSDVNLAQSLFTNILARIETWSLESGASLSLDKTHILHVCRKQNCNGISLTHNQTNIECKTQLKILGLIFDSNYNFNAHCKYVRNSLMSRLNIVKYLSSKHSFIHPNTLVNVVRALLTSKIDYGLPIYGNCSKSSINLLNAPYHCAIRRSLRAFPTSPIKTIMAESGLPTIQNKIIDSSLQILAKTAENTNPLLNTTITHATKKRKIPRIQSAISRCLSFAAENNILRNATRKFTTRHPPCLINDKILQNKLMFLSKQNTPNEVFQQTFAELESNYTNNGWKLLFTDGSKSIDSTSLAVVTATGEIICNWLLPSTSSVFTAEGSAILHAVNYAKKTKGKFLICTDSKSCMSAITSPSNRNPIIEVIRDAVIGAPQKIQVMWIPGHAGITGNHFADLAAKNVARTPALTYYVSSKQDILNLIKHKRHQKNASEWKTFKHHYAVINPARNRIIYSSTVPTSAMKTYTRLRIGHTIITHAHLLSGKSPSICPLCDDTASIKHLLTLCPMLHPTAHNSGNIDLIKLLSEPSEKNVMIVYRFLKTNDLLKYI
uniref:RNA-directed DNA polymerase from mobile element jockey n=1 Tax=Bactrocera tryoni TaxID=59916 RepID=A0A142LX47_BACRY|nr:hypothetical protein [Bactrocera tryoni]